MVKPTDQEKIAIEKRVTHSSQEEGAHHAMQDHTRRHQDGSGGRGSQEKCGQEPSLWFMTEGMHQAR